MAKEHFLINEVARLVGVKAHRIQYAISNSYIEEPAERINDKRIFTAQDIERVRAYFSAEQKGRGRRAKV